MNTTSMFTGLLALLASGIASAQCLLIVDGIPTGNRTDSNQFTATANLYPTQAIQGQWGVTLLAHVLFSVPPGAPSTIGSQQTHFTWSPSTPVGSGSNESVTATSTLEPYGTGSYPAQTVPSGTCGGVNYTISTRMSSGVSISRPSHPNYTTANHFLSYMGGASDTYLADNP